MSAETLKKVILFFVGAMAMLWGLWYIGVPADYIQSALTRPLRVQLQQRPLSIKGRAYYLDVQIKRLKKRILPAIEIGSVDVVARAGTDGIEVVSLRDMVVTPWWSQVLRGRTGMRVSGTLGTRGTFNGSFVIKGGSLDGAIQVESPLKDIALLNKFALQAEGFLRAKVLVGPGGGVRVKFKLHPFRAEDMVQAGLYIPLSFFNEIRGSLIVSPGTIQVRSLSLEGQKVDGSFSGTLQLQGSLVRGLLKVMPEKDFPESLLYVLRRYKKAPGLYEIPISFDLTSVRAQNPES